LAKQQNPGASQDELNDKAKKLYREAKDKGKIDEIYEKIKQDLLKKRSEKKAHKQSIKQAEKLASKQGLLSSSSP